MARWSYSDFYHALLMLSEERVGKPLRAQQIEETRKLERARSVLK